MGEAMKTNPEAVSEGSDEKTKKDFIGIADPSKPTAQELAKAYGITSPLREQEFRDNLKAVSRAMFRHANP